MGKKKSFGLILGLTIGLFQEASANRCPKLTYAKVYGIFAAAGPQNFTKEKTFFEKFIAIFTGDTAERVGPEVTLTVADVQFGDQNYKMVSRDDLSRLKDGGERSVFGGGNVPNREKTSFYHYSPMFRGDHCAYALAYGPGTPGGGLDMLRFELYLKEKSAPK